MTKKETKNLIKKAEQGDCSAQFNLDLMYKNGKGIEQDYEKAFYWYQKSQEHMKNKE